MLKFPCKQFEAQQLKELFTLVEQAGYRIAGPLVQNGAIAFGFLKSFSELPQGYKDLQSAGTYRLSKTGRPSFFEYAVGPHSIKNILHPSRRKLWEADRDAKHGFSMREAAIDAKPIAFFGLRACDLKALEVLDGVFLRGEYIDSYYQSMREGLFIVAVTCLAPSSLCFCTSMGYGPEPQHGDIKLTEIVSDRGHFFLAQAGTEKGCSILDGLHASEADEASLSAAQLEIEAATQRISKKLSNVGLPDLIKDRPLHPRWTQVADRCLSCGNCTMVCPTCFCTTTEDITDLKGEHTERWLTWDSCFTADFSYLHGGSVRRSTASRYRQWLTHKLSTWHDQFGQSGCVGCGRCIAWCPVGIDITEEAEALRREP